METLLVRDPNHFRIEDSSSTTTRSEEEFAVHTVVEATTRDNLWHVSIMVVPVREGAPVWFHTLRRCRWSER